MGKAARLKKLKRISNRSFIGGGKVYVRENGKPKRYVGECNGFSFEIKD